MLFDNLDFDFEVSWQGSHASLLIEEFDSPTIVRAVTLKKDRKNRHLAYAPDFFKHCESTFDLALFYAGKPLDTNFIHPSCVWQAFGFWSARRGRHIPSNPRSGDATDSIIFSEDGVPSNLKDDGAFVAMPLHAWEDTEQHRNWESKLTTDVYQYCNTIGDRLNPQNQKQRGLCERLNLPMAPPRFSGYAQAKRPCDLRFQSLALFEATRKQLFSVRYLAGFGIELQQLIARIEFIAKGNAAHWYVNQHQLVSLKTKLEGFAEYQGISLPATFELLIKRCGSCREKRKQIMRESFDKLMNELDLNRVDLKIMVELLSYLGGGVENLLAQLNQILDQMLLEHETGQNLHASFAKATDAFIQSDIKTA